MNVTWHGFSCFRISESRTGGEVALVTDPYAPESGMKLSRSFAADIVAVSHDDSRHDNAAAVGGDPFVITGPGEYEVKDIFVTGIPTDRNTIYYITVGDIHIVHLGALGRALEERDLEQLHNVDILFVPVGGGDVLAAKQAAEVVGQLEPRVIIPMHYKTPGMDAKLDGVEPFLKIMGLGKPEALPKLKIAAKDLPQEEMKIIVFEPQ